MQGGLLHRSTLSVLARKRSTIPCFGTMQTSLMVDEDRPIKSRSRAGGLTHDVRHEVNQGPDRGRNAPSGGCRAHESLMMTLSLNQTSVSSLYNVEKVSWLRTEGPYQCCDLEAS